MTPDELLTTTRAVRKRLDFERPMSREVLLECVEVAPQAPTGSNRQGWHFVFVSEPSTKAALADLYRQGYDPYASMPRPQYPEGDPRGEAEAAELLGIPYDDYTQGGLMPVAYYTGTSFSPAARLPAESVVHWESW